LRQQLPGQVNHWKSLEIIGNHWKLFEIL